jgi:hypothetical protein
VHIKISPSVNPSVFSSCVFGQDLGKARDTSDSNEDFIEASSVNRIAVLC